MTSLRTVVCAALLLVCAVQAGCAKIAMPNVKMPKVSMPKLPTMGTDDEDANITPRDMLTAKLANPRANPDTPNMTVGKMIEFADRYLACDCAKTRFVRFWEKTADGYRLYTNSEVVRPIEFICADVEDGRECYLREIDRGPKPEALEDRFVPGSEFIQFLYDNGVQCQRETPCP
jgi:hypothetical protein